MPRNGSGVYALPSGSTVANGDTSDATDINTPLQDLEADMNTVRPIVAGGTGASSAAGARENLGATATGVALFTAADAAAGRTALDIPEVGLEKISRTVLASAASTLNVTWDNTDYDTIEIHLQNCIPATDGVALRGRTSADGVTYDSGTSAYGYRQVTRQLGATESAESIGATTTFMQLTGNVGNDTAEGGASLVVVLQQAGIAKQTKINWNGTYNTGVSATEAGVKGWGRRSIAALVEGFQFYYSSGNIQAGAIVTVYGYRK